MNQMAVDTAVELTPIILAILGFVFAMIQIVAKYYIDKRTHDAQLRDMLEKAVSNGLGAIQQSASGVVIRASPQLLGVVPGPLIPGVQYVLNHASEAVERFGITPALIAEKIISRTGLREIDTNIAATASNTPGVIPPLAPSSPITTASVLNRQELERIMAGERAPR